MSNSSAPPPGRQELRVPVTEEVLSVGTRTVDTGRGVRVHKTVHTQSVTIDETLAHDELDVRHVAIGRTLDQGETTPTTRHEGDTLIIPVLEEVLVVERRLRLKEELHITRVRREEPFVQTVMLKTDQVSVERFDENGDG
jgi:stress response protein YsnF